MENPYGYTPCAEDVSQYEGYDLKAQKIVPAIYVHAELEEDAGNPYIEALPHMRSDPAIMAAYSTDLPSYSLERVRNASKYQKFLQIGTLRNLRFPLPFHSILELQLHNALLTSYRARARMPSPSNPIPFTVGNREQKSSSILTGNSSDSTNAGFSLIGYSGCGKSSAVSVSVSHYPQVIMHSDGEGGYFPQITYLVVNCVANSNFAALYQGIGEAIDKALGNTTPVYEKEILKTRTLGAKGEKVKEFIEFFAIGILIFDEIQLIDFSHTKENTFDSLLNLTNRTKVAIAVVGTEDARRKMFPELRTARRIGNVIDGNQYCKDRKIFEFLARQLFRYQWFDEVITPDKELVDALFSVTKGIIDQLISIYSWMNIEYLQSTKRPTIDGKYVKHIAKQYFSGMQDALALLEMEENEESLSQAKLNAQVHLQEILDAAQQEENTNKILQSREAVAEQNAQLGNVIANIRVLYDDYSDSQIEAAFKKIVVKDSNKGKSERDISRLVLEQLQKAPTRRVSKNTIAPPDVSHMKNFLGLSGDADGQNSDS